MSTAPWLSVIMPAKNAAATLGQAVDSLLLQSRTDWELLIIDDQSTDQTGALAFQFEQQDARVRRLSGPGHGVSAARNCGLSQARGRYVLFLDADDWIAPEYIETMETAFCGAPEARAAYCGDQRVTAAGIYGSMRWNCQVELAPFETFARECAVAIHSVVVERAVIASLGGFDEQLETCEDWDLWQRVARTGVRFIGVRQPLSFYRMRAGSLSQNVAQLMSDALAVLNRGFAVDDRVDHPHAPYRHGARPEERGPRSLWAAYFAIWCAAYEVGAGSRGPAAVLETVQPLPDLANFVYETADTLIDGLAVGLGVSKPDIAERWNEFESALGVLIGEIASASPRGWTRRRLEYAVQRRAVYASSLRKPVHLSLVMAQRIDIRHLDQLPAPSSQDLLIAHFHAGSDCLFSSEYPVIAVLTKTDLVAEAINRLGAENYARLAQLQRRPAYWFAVATRIWQRTLWQRTRLAGSPVPNESIRSFLKNAVNEAAFERNPGSNGNHIAKIMQGAKPEITECLHPPTSRDAATVEATREEKSSSPVSRIAYWETLFSTPNPWNYESAYEQLKYKRTLDLMPASPIVRALELACAEGHFTAQLAPHVEHLCATDISERALSRARKRCACHSNVSYAALDFFDNPVPGPQDLIVCSEVLYYLDGVDKLASVAQRLANALTPGGYLLTAHAFILKDDMNATGFDWEHPFGAAVIFQALQATKGLAIERSIITELYRIDLFRRLVPGELKPEPTQVTLPLAGYLADGQFTSVVEPEIARQAVWGGAAARRIDVQNTETTRTVPVLMYHRVADEGPEILRRYRTAQDAFRQQIQWLRANGYHSLTSREIAEHLSKRLPFRGRPVLITFDDGFKDFADRAWPVLMRHDFIAEVFVVTDLVGQSAEWDSSHGTPTPLMSWDDIAALAAQGVEFGSHFASHTPADALSSIELIRELGRSQRALQQVLGRPVHSLAAPHGVIDPRVAHIAKLAGFEIQFSTNHGHLTLDSSPLNIPRVEVQGGWTLDDFIRHVRESEIHE